MTDKPTIEKLLDYLEDALRGVLDNIIPDDESVDKVLELRQAIIALEAGMRGELVFVRTDPPEYCGCSGWVEATPDGEEIQYKYGAKYGGRGYGDKESCIEFARIRGLPIRFAEENKYPPEKGGKEKS